MAKTTLVSMRLPVFNGQMFLRQVIESILNKDFKDFELIISDNALTDDIYLNCASRSF